MAHKHILQSSHGWPLFAPTRSQRRVLVLAAYAGYGLVVATMALHLWLITLPAAAVFLVGLAGLLWSTYYLVANDTDRALDERQQIVRDRAYRVAYTVLATLCLLAVVYGEIAVDSKGSWWLPRSANEMQVVLWAVLLLIFTLPTAIVSWTEPDAPKE
jgi:hypothetical protein